MLRSFAIGTVSFVATMILVLSSSATGSSLIG